GHGRCPVLRRSEEIIPVSKRVLICDDSILMRRMISQTLSECGWECVGEASDGQEAVERYRATRPEVVTMDIVMPGSDGLYGLEEILAFDPQAKVIVVSAINQSKLI